MGACCTSRDSFHFKTEPCIQLQLYQSKTRLSDIHKRLQELNLNLTYFQVKARDFKHLGSQLKQIQNEYLDRESHFLTCVQRMNEVMIQTEKGGEEAMDLVNEELMGVIQSVSVRKSQEHTLLRSRSLRDYVTYPEEIVNFHAQIGKGVEEVRTTSIALLSYMRLVESCKANINEAIDGLDEAAYSIGNEKWEGKVRKWEHLLRNTKKLAEDMTIYSKDLLAAYQAQVDALSVLKKEVDAHFEREYYRRSASDAHSSAQRFLHMQANIQRSIPKPLPGPTLSPVIPRSRGIPVHMDIGLRSLCTENDYKSADLLPSASTYNLLMSVIHSKSAADRQAAGNRTTPLPLEIYLLCYLATLHVSQSALLNATLQFVASLDRLSSTFLGELALELLKMTEKVSMSIHEEGFICKAISLLRPMLIFSDEESWENGGFMSLYQAIKAVEHWFQNEPDVCEMVIAGLMPSVSSLDIVVYYVKARLVEEKKTPDELFREIDTEKRHHLRRDEVVKGLKTRLNIKLPEKTLEELSEILDKAGSNCIFRSEVSSLFTLKSFTCDSLRISCVRILTSLRTAFLEWKSKLSSQLYLDFILLPLNDYKASIKDIIGLVYSLNPDITGEEAEFYLQRMEMKIGDWFDFETFREFVLLNPIGTAAESFFCKHYTGCSGVAWTQEKHKLPEVVLNLFRGKSRESKPKIA